MVGIVSKEIEEIKEKALYDVNEVASLLKVGRSTVLGPIQKAFVIGI